MQDMIITLERAMASLHEAVGEYLADQRPSTYDRLERAHLETAELLAKTGGR